MTTNNTTNNAEPWADEVDRTNPFSGATKSDEKPEGCNNGTEVQKKLAEGQKSGAESQNYVAEVRNIVAELVNNLAEVQIQNNPDTEVGSQSPEVARVESAAIKTRHVGSNTEDELDSVFTEVGQTYEYDNLRIN